MQSATVFLQVGIPHFCKLFSPSIVGAFETWDGDPQLINNPIPICGQNFNADG